MKTDPELMEELRQGREAAFEELVERHQDGLINFLYRLAWDRTLAEDLAQEVFLRLYTHRGEYEPRAKFTTYLYRIARNCWVDHLRRTKGERRNRSLDAETEDGRALRDSLAREVEQPGETTNKGELAEAVIEAIDLLPEDHKAVFLLSEVEGMKYQEISDVLGIPVGTVKSRMFHAIQRLRDKLSRSLKDLRGLPPGAEVAHTAGGEA